MPTKNPRKKRKTPAYTRGRTSLYTYWVKYTYWIRGGGRAQTTDQFGPFKTLESASRKARSLITEIDDTASVSGPSGHERTYRAVVSSRGARGFKVVMSKSNPRRRRSR